MKYRIIGNSIPNLPWEERPQGCSDLVWRFSKNPLIGWNPIPKAARIFNSAVISYKSEFVGVFRADQKNGRATLFSGKSHDGLRWEIGPDPINWVDEEGKPKPLSYGYDPRLVKIENTYYIVWCDDLHGPSIGLGKTQ
ncbi:MAG TPA: glycosylase, partial [Candidatus Marinimicrobia bacterium]|nr:glycosylase [Candidatus Neomarinimicrobiota bacterium]